MTAMTAQAASFNMKKASIISMPNNRRRGTLVEREPDIEIPEDLCDKVNVNYSNVLPSNLRHGNKNVMPLIPKNLEKAVTNTQMELFQKVMRNSAYALA